MGTKRRPKTQKRRPLQNRLEILRKQQEVDSRPKQKRGTITFAVFNEFGQSQRSKSHQKYKTKTPWKSPWNCLKTASNCYRQWKLVKNDSLPLAFHVDIYNCVTLFQLIKCFKVETVGNAVVQLQFELFQLSNGSVTVFSIFHIKMSKSCIWWQPHDSDEDSEQ